MQLTESDEQRQLRQSVRRFLAEKSPLPVVRRLMDTPAGYDQAVWRQAAEQLGLPALAIPEQYGGAGFSFVEQAIVLEELGRALYPGPYLASAVLAAGAILRSGDEQAAKDLLPGIAAGSVMATLAFAEDGGSWDAGAANTLTATPDGTGFVLSGHKNFVPYGHVADLVLAIGRTAAGLSLFAVRGDAVTRTALSTLDQTRKLARLEFHDVPARLVGTDGGAGEVLASTLDVAALALAAEQLGAAQAALDMAVAYAKEREQFGRPIGSFQAIKHRCADLLLELENTRSAVLYASWAVAEDSTEVPVLAALAKAYASDAFFHIAAENIQIHGGIGFTWEHDAHLYFKRAKADELFLGDAAYHRAHLADRIGI
jgi:alkylation response protein AidB-like acyl-CoA dehydrogenase